MTDKTDKTKIPASDSRQPHSKTISRRTALKLFGAGAVGAIGTAYGLNRLIAEEPIDMATAMNRNINPSAESPLVPTQAQATYAPINNTTMTDMKVVLINGSPRRNGNTFICLAEIASVLEAEGVKTKIIQLGPKPVQGCNNCQGCKKSGICIFDDPLYLEVRNELADADGMIIGSPVYYAGPNGALCALLDRVFYTSGNSFHHKVGSAVAVCRRGGASATLDRLNKYFSITNMNTVGSQYWNLAHGAGPGEVREDAEGLQIMRTLGRNMAWTIRNTRLAQQTTPEPEKRMVTNFIR